MVLDLIGMSWKMVVLRGALAIALGCLMLVAPANVLVFALIVFGGYCIVDGIFSIASGTPITPVEAVST